MKSPSLLGKAMAGAAMIAFAAIVPVPAHAAESVNTGKVTFYKDILPILQENCQSCHRSIGMNAGGMVAPMSLTTFKEVRPWAKSIVKQVQAKTMPPWHADEAFHGVFDNERTLSDGAIAAITRWVNTGARPGNPNDAPPDRVWVEEESDGWSIGKPDLIISMEPYFVKDDVEDLNINFETVLTDLELPEDTWVQAIEYKAGSEVVHHICNTATAPKARSDLDESLRSNGLGCIAPGSDARGAKEGYGSFLPKNATIIWGMHYHKEAGPGTGLWDQSQMAFIFNKTPVYHQTQLQIIEGGNGFEIPPNHPNWMVGAARTFKEPTTILGYLPHMHFRGNAAEYRAFYPDGSNELLLRVPRYDYNWQTLYRYGEPKEVPAGTRVEVTMWYSNTEEKSEASGFNFNRAVKYGGPTTDEMMNGWIDFTNTIPRDFTADLAPGEVTSSKESSD